MFICSVHLFWIPMKIRGGPKKMQHLWSIISRKRGTEWKICVHHCLYNSFPSKMTPRSLILRKAFQFYGRFSEAMSFSGFALLFKKSQFMYQHFSIVWLPRVKCPLLLCKAKPTWIKRSIQLRNFILFLIFLKLIIKSVAFFLGHHI